MTGITVLAGGVGGARFTRGLLAHLAAEYPAAPVPVTVVVNTGDDMWLTGLRICPDLDTVMYTLGGGVAENQGWGRADETRRTSGEIAAYGAGWDWFTLGDLDLGTHIVRTDLLRSGSNAHRSNRDSRATVEPRRPTAADERRLGRDARAANGRHR